MIVVGWSNVSRNVLNQPLTNMAVFSSIAGVLGSAGQANYAAANATLDELACQQYQQGISTTSVQWGVWSNAGMAASNPALLRKLASQGYGALKPATGLDLLQRSLVHLSKIPVRMLSEFNWSVFLSSNGRAMIPFFSELVPAALSSQETAKLDASDHRRQLPNTSQVLHSTEEIYQAVISAVAEIVGEDAVTMLSADLPLLETGIDSIGAVDFRHVISHSKYTKHFLFHH